MHVWKFLSTKHKNFNAEEGPIQTWKSMPKNMKTAPKTQLKNDLGIC